MERKNYLEILFVNRNDITFPVFKKIDYKPVINQKESDRIWGDFLLTHPTYFNGPLLGISDVYCESGKLIVEYFDTWYKDFVYSRHIQEQGLSNPFTVSLIFITSDNKIILAPRHGNLKHWQLAGGMFDPLVDVTNGGYDPVKCGEREIAEELCKLDFYDHHFLGFGTNHQSTISSAIYCSNVKQSADYILERHAAHEGIDYHEMEGAQAVSIEMQEFSNLLLDKTDKILGHTNRYSLLLLSHYLYGEEFYQTHLKEMSIAEKEVTHFSNDGKVSL